MIESESEVIFSLLVVPIEEVSKRLRIPHRTVDRDLDRALGKISRTGNLEKLFALSLAQRAANAAAAARVRIRCGSVECQRAHWFPYEGGTC
jgi:hypothetical protein